MAEDLQLAQVNVARLRAAPGAAEVAGFIAAVDPVNRIADASPGLVWRLPAGEGHVVTTTDGDRREVLNLSVWASYESLHAFVYRSRHGAFVKHRDRWFESVRQPSTALWWVPAGERPEVAEALRRLALLRADGPSPRAFTLRRRFGPDGRPEATGSRSRGRRSPGYG